MKVRLHALRTSTINVVVVNFTLINLNSAKIIYMCENYGCSGGEYQDNALHLCDAVYFGRYMLIFGRNLQSSSG